MYNFTDSQDMRDLGVRYAIKGRSEAMLRTVLTTNHATPETTISALESYWFIIEHFSDMSV